MVSLVRARAVHADRLECADLIAISNIVLIAAAKVLSERRRGERTTRDARCMVEELVARAGLEEVCGLMWNGTLPSSAEREARRSALLFFS